MTLLKVVSMLNRFRVSALLLAICPLFLVACGDSASQSMPSKSTGLSDPVEGDGGVGGCGYQMDEKGIAFVDTQESNIGLETGIADLSFSNLKGERVKVSDLASDKNIVLVIIRGSTGPVCPYCSTQTSRLISNYKKFADRDAEIVVVYPVEKKEDVGQWDEFMKVTREKLENSQVELPFPVLFDTELKAVTQLGIQQDLSKPATYILDKKGQVSFAYVGSTFADRPSIKAMLERLDKLNQKAKSETKS